MDIIKDGRIEYMELPDTNRWACFCKVSLHGILIRLFENVREPSGVLILTVDDNYEYIPDSAEAVLEKLAEYV